MAKKKTGTDVEVLDADDGVRSGIDLDALRASVTLSKDETERLAACERVIAEGFEEFLKVCIALKTIRDERLYRQDFGAFEDYARERWGLHRSTLYRRIDFADVVESLSPVGDTVKNEAQARELARLTPEQRVVVAERIKKHGKSLSEASAKWIREEAEQVSPRERNPDTRQTVDTRRVRTFLEKLNVFYRTTDDELLHGRAGRLRRTREELLAWVTDPDHPERVHRMVYLWAILPDKRAVKAALKEQGRDAEKELSVKP